jgi:ankyrin repeat protein
MTGMKWWIWIAPLLAMLAGCGNSLHDLVAVNDEARVAALLKAHPESVRSLNRLGKTPLHYAVTYQRTACMQLLLDHGADINAQDKTGMTPLHVAAMMGFPEEAAWLLDHGAKIDLRDRFGDTPAHMAALFCNGRVVKLLHERGASIDGKNNEAKTVLDLAREHRCEKLAQYLESLTPAKQETAP